MNWFKPKKNKPVDVRILAEADVKVPRRFVVPPEHTMRIAELSDELQAQRRERGRGAVAQIEMWGELEKLFPEIGEDRSQWTFTVAGGRIVIEEKLP